MGILENGMSVLIKKKQTYSLVAPPLGICPQGMTPKPTECITQAFHSSPIHVSLKLELTQVNRQVIKQTRSLHSGDPSAVKRS